MIYGELGRFPLVIYVKSRMINYWCRMLNNDNKNKLSFRICNALLSDYVFGTHVYKWFNFVEISVMKLGLLTYGYPKISLSMEMSLILFLKDLKISICSYGETTFIIQAKALTIGFLKKS